VVAVFTPATGGLFSGSTSAPGAVQVLPAASASTTTLTLDRPEVVEGTGTRAVARVGGTTSPRGVVRFAVAGLTQEVPVLDGEAVWSVPALAVGTHRVDARFVPADERFALPSDAAPATLTVTPTLPVVTVPGTIASTTTLTAPASVVAGSTFGVQAQVSVAGGNAEGRVVFTSGWSSVTVPVSGGRASATLHASGTGGQAVQAEFVPTRTEVAHSLGTAQVRVGAAATRTAVTAKANVRARVVTVASTTTGGPAPCSGLVRYTLTRGAKKVGKAVQTQLRCTGRTTVVLPLPKRKGRYTVTATYRGSAVALASTGKVTFKR